MYNNTSVSGLCGSIRYMKYISGHFFTPLLEIWPQTADMRCPSWLFLFFFLMTWWLQDTIMMLSVGVLQNCFVLRVTSFTSKIQGTYLQKSFEKLSKENENK